jgi:HEAT repeat protein
MLMKKKMNNNNNNLKKYQATTNTVIQRNILFDIGLEFKRTAAVEQWHSQVVQLALTNDDPTVVEAGIQTAQILKLIEFKNECVALYFSAEQKFPGYGERVQYAVVDAMGELGGSEAEYLFKNFLETDNGSPMVRNIIEGIGKIKAVSLIPVLQLYSHKMEQKGAQQIAANRDPVFYQSYFDYARIAHECAQSLETIKGGSK